MSSKMADQDFTAGEDVLDQLMKRLDAEIEVFIKAKEPDANDLPRVTRSRDLKNCLLYTSPSPRDRTRSRMPSSA